MDQFWTVLPCLKTGDAIKQGEAFACLLLSVVINLLELEGTKS